MARVFAGGVFVGWVVVARVVIARSVEAWLVGAGDVAGRLAGAPGGVDHQMPPTNRPGANRCPGSNWSLIRRISARPATGPHMSRVSRTPAGAVRTTAWPPSRTHSAR